MLCLRTPQTQKHCNSLLHYSDQTIFGSEQEVNCLCYHIRYRTSSEFHRVKQLHSLLGKCQILIGKSLCKVAEAGSIEYKRQNQKWLPRAENNSSENSFHILRLVWVILLYLHSWCLVCLSSIIEGVVYCSDAGTNS